MFQIQTSVQKHFLSFAHFFSFIFLEIYIKTNKNIIKRQFHPSIQSLLVFFSILKLLHFQLFFDTYIIKKIKLHNTFKIIINFIYIFAVITYLIHLIYYHITLQNTKITYILLPILYYIIIMTYIFLINLKKSFKDSTIDDYSIFQKIIGINTEVNPDNTNNVKNITVSHHELFVFMSSWFITNIFFQILNSN